MQGGEKKAQFFFDMDAKMEDDGRGKKRKHDGEGPPKAQGPCWFCLSSAEVGEGSIIDNTLHSCRSRSIS